MTSLLDSYDGLLLDLDGTLYRGGTPVPGASSTLADAARRGVLLSYLTNNGARNANSVAAHLNDLGFAATEAAVVTSGQAAARVLAERLPGRSVILVVGSPDLGREVMSEGFTITDDAPEADGVVQGHFKETAWPKLAEACLAIRCGALWVACNVDATLPSERGQLPGNGSMVAALRTATGAEPVLAGKPRPWLFEEAVRRSGARRPLVVGDRLDTDIAGAEAAGLPALLVLTGISDAAAVLAASARERPRYLGADIGVLDEDREAVEVVIRPPWTVRSDGPALVLGTDGGRTPTEPVSALRALCAAHWRDGGGEVKVRAADEVAAATLRTLGLDG